MEVLSNEDYLNWAASVGIGFDSRFPGAQVLGFHPARYFARFWTLPDDPGAWPHFASCLLRGLDEWGAVYLWPRSGQWPRTEKDSSRNERVRDVILRGAGIPTGLSGAIRFSRNEEDTILALIFASFAFGCYIGDDVYVIPEHGRQLLRTDHHGVVHARCLDEQRIEALVAHMAGAGYELPTELPDVTFKWPSWMGAPPP
jgi:hypothetical protein